MYKNRDTTCYSGTMQTYTDVLLHFNKEKQKDEMLWNEQLLRHVK